MALIYGHFVSDRLPLFICRRTHSTWLPEFRLYPLILPALIFNSIGLGLFGLALQNHLHWGVLLWAQIMVTFGALSTTPMTVNYACEIFTQAPAETAIVLNSYRVAFGLSVAFYIAPWVEKMGFRWAYGLMAFLQVGREIRRLKMGMLGSDEEGEVVMEEKGRVSGNLGEDKHVVDAEKGDAAS
ncbi:polyamine transporter protein [Rutstroemia sp. NJR-2017a BBW]|nr:polyamine transporter protein [Rutstroemia sp. NJR-2017a BBW]